MVELNEADLQFYIISSKNYWSGMCLYQEGKERNKKGLSLIHYLQEVLSFGGNRDSKGSHVQVK